MADTFVSTGAFADSQLGHVFETAKRLGICRIELSSNLAYEKNIISQVIAAKNEFKFLVHNYFPPARVSFVLNLASANESIRQRSMALVMEALSLCLQIGSPLYSVHCGFTFDGDGSQLGNARQLDQPRISMEEAMANFIKSLETLLPIAERMDIILAIENNAIADFALIDGENFLALGADASSFSYIFEQFDSDYLHLLLDLGHAKVNAATLGQPVDKMIDLFKDRIVALHISDNDGRNDLNWPIGPDSDLWPYIRRNSSAFRVIESNPTDEKTLMDQIYLLREDVSSPKSSEPSDPKEASL